ncbi:MAG: hypothetical protein A2Z88_01645 [Omnitrophica WOR_2 bacterium GWA2_47_8]|nr:MAG: hypothetical protein A2Z88_01645 [Omnitrophica WOR_2 bacterium GWA2_47_8]
MFIYLDNENIKKAVSLVLLAIGMLIFTVTTLAHVDAKAREAEAKLQLIYATMSWDDMMYQKYKKMVFDNNPVPKR